MKRLQLSLAGLGGFVGFLAVVLGSGVPVHGLLALLSVTVVLGGLALTQSGLSLPLVTLLGLFARLPFAVFAPINDDSSVYYAIAKQLAEGTFVFTGHIGVELVMAGFVFLFGRAGANIASFTAAILTIPIVGAAAIQLFSSRRVGIAAATAMALTPLHIYFSSWAYTEPIAICFFSLALYAIVSDRYLWSVVLVGVLFVMRFEYAVLILAPLLVLRLSDRAIIRRAVVGIPVLGTGTIVVISALTPAAPRQSWLVSILNTSLYSVSFLQNLTVDPIAEISRNILFYTIHFFHWGVPYWHGVLVNPVLPALFLVGAAALLPQDRMTVLAFVIAPGTLLVGFVVRELFGVSSQSLALALIILVASGFLLLLAAGPLSQPEFQPLFALVPYTMLLLVLYLAPRYLLPVVVVGCLYVGFGAVKLYDAIWTGDRWTIRIRIPA